MIYSAREGESAEDDAGGANSPFASALVAELKVPGLEARRVFDNVRDDVLEATANRQQPFTYGSYRVGGTCGGQVGTGQGPGPSST